MTDLFEQSMAEMDTAVEADKAAAAQKELGGDKPAENPNTFGRWMKNLPSNMTVGLLDAAINMQDAGDELLGKEEQSPHQKRMAPSDAAPPLNAAVAMGRGLEQGEFEPRQALALFRNFFAQGADGKGSSTSDAITQSAAQFMIPFTGFSKAFAGFKAAQNAPKVVQLGGKVAQAGAAETATLATAFDPHGGRLADLVEFGRHTEGKLADTLNTLAPDGSAINAYIDYMTDRVNESDAEGRFKNVIDGLAGSAAVAGLLKTGAKTIRVARMGLEHVVPSGPGSAIPNQAGMVAYHGTPHEFDEFTLSAIGSGEGAQAFGHGLYFAEEKGVATQYAIKLSKTEPGEVNRAKEWVKSKTGKDPAEDWGYRDPRDYLRLAATMGFVPKTTGKVYEVDIPDEAVAKMIDYDAPLSEQPEVLKRIPKRDQEKLEQLLDDHGMAPDLQDYTGNQLQQLIGRAINEDYIRFDPADGAFDNTKKLAAEYFLSRDIPGIRYLDGGSRKKGEGTRNIVLFDDKLVKVKNKGKAGA